MTDPFEYQPPNEITAPKYAAIRAAEEACRKRIMLMVGVGPWQGEHAGIHDARAAFAEITEACRDFWRTIMETAPPSADRTAAERCVRLARMAANEAVPSMDTAQRGDLWRQCSDNLRAARWQACAAIALADS